MKRSLKIVLILTLLAAASATVLLASRTEVKEPAVAGTFYPSDREELRRSVDQALGQAAAAPGNGRLIALVAPHAGYMFSGRVAAFSYRRLAERPVDTVILIGASHFESYAGASVWAEGAWRTPLGDVKVNEPIAKALLDKDAGVVFFREAFKKEHSLEVQVPFLQRTLRDFTIVPILIGGPTQQSFRFLADRLTEVLRTNDRAIIVISTDLSHYHDQKTAGAKDRTVIDAVERMSVEDLESVLRSGDGEACGGYPLLLTMMVSRNLGATNGVLFRVATSGDTTGDLSRVVGYAAMGLYRSPLTEAQKKELATAARQAVVNAVKGGKRPESAPKDPRFRANGATFVTITRHGQLRGCIGNIQPLMPLYDSVLRNAASAALRDPRFPAMTPAELSDMEIEVTVLSPLEPTEWREVKIGEHGLFLVKGGNSGVFLPQVPVEQHWDLRTYLEELSQKAGLPRDAWKEKDSRLYRFTAEIIREH